MERWIQTHSFSLHQRFMTPTSKSNERFKTLHLASRQHFSFAYTITWRPTSTAADIDSSLDSSQSLTRVSHSLLDSSRWAGDATDGVSNNLTGAALKCSLTFIGTPMYTNIQCFSYTGNARYVNKRNQLNICLGFSAVNWKARKVQRPNRHFRYNHDDNASRRNDRNIPQYNQSHTSVKLFYNYIRWCHTN